MKKSFAILTVLALALTAVVLADTRVLTLTDGAAGSVTVLPVAQGGTGSATGIIGGVTPAAGAFTTLTASSTLVVTGNITNSALTASLPVFTDANKRLASVTVANAKLALGIQAGSATSAGDGVKTSTFPTAFSTAPIVVVTATGAAAPTLQYVITNISATAFITVGDASGTYNWIAVGAP